MMAETAGTALIRLMFQAREDCIGRFAILDERADSLEMIEITDSPVDHPTQEQRTWLVLLHALKVLEQRYGEEIPNLTIKVKSDQWRMREQILGNLPLADA